MYFVHIPMSVPFENSKITKHGFLVLCKYLQVQALATTGWKNTLTKNAMFEDHNQELNTQSQNSASTILKGVLGTIEDKTSLVTTTQTTKSREGHR